MFKNELWLIIATAFFKAVQRKNEKAEELIRITLHDTFRFIGSLAVKFITR